MHLKFRIKSERGEGGVGLWVREGFILSPFAIFLWINVSFSNLFITLCTNSLFVAVGCFCKRL